jgi:hypothetical protein
MFRTPTARDENRSSPQQTSIFARKCRQPLLAVAAGSSTTNRDVSDVFCPTIRPEYYPIRTKISRLHLWLSSGMRQKVPFACTETTPGQNMNDKSSRELAVFAAALELPVEDRAAYLARESGDDHALRARVEALLRADSEAGNFLEQPPDDFPAANSNVIGEKPGDLIGRYKLLEQIGE